MRKRSRGVTLAELVVAGILSLTVLALGALLLTASRHMASVTSTSLLISRDLSLGAERLREDLKETALGTLRVENGAQPAATMVSASSPNGKIQIDSQGTPDWQGWAHYLLEETDSSGGVRTGALVKWMEYPSSPMPYPGVSRTSPLSVPSGTEKRTVLNNVVFPNQVLTDSKSAPLPISDSDGFSVRFLRLNETGDYEPSDENPAVTSANADDIHGNTRLIEVRVRTYTKANSGQVDTVGIHFRVCPRF